MDNISIVTLVEATLTTFNPVFKVLLGDDREMNRIARFLRDEQGQDLIEYTLLLAVVALGSASIYIATGNSTQTIWSSASNSLKSAATQAS
jgi:Flp pilus assembly pilin Flp